MNIHYESLTIDGMYYVREVKNRKGERGGYLLINNYNKPVKNVYYFFKHRINYYGDSINSIKRYAYDLCHFYNFMNIVNISPELLTSEYLIEFINNYLRVINPKPIVNDAIEKSMLKKLPILEEYTVKNVSILNRNNSRGIEPDSVARILMNVKLYLMFLKEYKDEEIDIDNIFLIKDIKINKNLYLLGHIKKSTKKVYSVAGILKASNIPYRKRGKIKPIDEECIFEKDEEDLFFSYLNEYSPSIKLLFNLLERTGMRIGEALGIRVSSYSVYGGDCFMEDKDCDIRLVDNIRNIWRVRIVFRQDNPTDLQLKFNKERIIEFIDNEKVFFNLYKEAMMYRTILMKTKEKSHDFLFINTLGNRLKYSRINQIFNEIMKKCGLQARIGNINIHSFRHTYASRWIKCMNENKYDVELEELSKMLGHSSSKMTRETYIHLFNEEKRGILQKMNNCIYQKGGNKYE